MSRKLIVNDGRSERELLLVGTMVVGRDPTCDISSVDPLLSRRHVEFVMGATGVLVRDLGSRNGILVNGVKVAQGRLQTGDLVQVGHLQVRFIEDAAPLVVPPDAGVDPEATAMVMQPAAPAAVPEDLDRTVPPGRGLDAAPAVARATPAAARIAVQPPASPLDASDPDKTRFAPPPVVAPAARPASKAAPPAPARVASGGPTGVEDADRTFARSPGPPAPSEYGRTPRLEMQPFLGPGDRVRFDVPRTDWQLVSGGTVAIVTLAQRNGQAAVVVEQTQLHQALAPDDMTDLFAQLEADAIRERQPAAADVHARLVAVDGRRLAIVRYTRLGVAGPERVRQYSIPAGRDLYRLTCSAAATEFARYEPIFAHVAASFATPRKAE